MEHGSPQAQMKIGAAVLEWLHALPSRPETLRDPWLYAIACQALRGVSPSFVPSLLDQLLAENARLKAEVIRLTQESPPQPFRTAKG